MKDHVTMPSAQWLQIEAELVEAKARIAALEAALRSILDVAETVDTYQPASNAECVMIDIARAALETKGNQDV